MEIKNKNSSQKIALYGQLFPLPLPLPLALLQHKLCISLTQFDLLCSIFAVDFQSVKRKCFGLMRRIKLCLVKLAVG
jgi:hypothetical protein